MKHLFQEEKNVSDYLATSDLKKNIEEIRTTSPSMEEVVEWDPWNPPHSVRVDRTYYSAIAIYMAFLFVISFFLNLMVLITYFKNKSLRTPINYIIINLTVADFLGVITSNSVSVVTNTAGRFFGGKWMCAWEGYIASVTGITGEISIAVMALERCIVARKPINVTHFSKRHALYGILFTWIYSLLWNTPPLLLWNGYDAEGLGTSCAPNYFVTEPNERLFILLYFVFCFFIPFLTIAVSYGKLIYTLRQVSSSLSPSGNRSCPDKEVTKMVVVMISAFCFCWTPYAVISLYSVFVDHKFYAIGALPAFFAKSATVYNPLIYIGLNREFRDCAIRLVFKGRNPWIPTPIGFTPGRAIDRDYKNRRGFVSCPVSEPHEI